MWLGIQFSNFGISTKNTNNAFVDSISVQNVNQSISLNGNLNLGSGKENANSIQINFNRQKSKEVYEYNEFNNSEFRAIIGSLSYTHSSQNSFGYTAGIHYNENTTKIIQISDQLISIESYGAFGNFNMPLMEKPKIRLQVGARLSQTGEQLKSKSLAYGFTNNLTIPLSKKQMINLSHFYNHLTIRNTPINQNQINLSVSSQF